MNTFEVPGNYNEVFDQVHSKLLEEVEELATNPDNNFGVTPFIYDLLSKKQKIPSSSVLWDLVARIGQDLRINPHQIDAIRSEIFFD